MSNVPENVEPTRFLITVRGVVQGVGFRPFVYNTAGRYGLTGLVRNETDRVRIELQGDPAAIERFLETLRNAPPPAAKIESIDVEPLAICERETTFEIRESLDLAAPRPTIPADLATCPACLEEIRTPGERRYRYPFTNCTHCGPRWSIIEGVPYDRPRTSMSRFDLCDDCRREYENPSDRRFHAQPIACPQCGPRLELLNASGEPISRDEAALEQTIEAISAGRIVAIKGLGGFQLVVDATCDEPVKTLRARKRRPHKPFALMMTDQDMVRQYCELSDREAADLESVERPILLLKRKKTTRSLPESVAPGQPNLGIMLPYTPLHQILMDTLDRPIVCTSGNLAEEPMATTTDEAVTRLGPIADLILTHNRPIVRPVDDSVAWRVPDGLQLLRRARGFAPRAIRIAQAGPTVLAVGGHLKNTVGLRLENDVILSAHVGDLETFESVEVFRHAVDDLVGFFDVVPDRVACDLHPDYASTRYAETLAQRWNVPLVRVQHHLAHVAAVVAEHRLDGPVLGLAFDGTGYGTDGTVWGGEVLLGEKNAFRRVAHLKTFALPGGDRAVRDPRRSALGLLYEHNPELASSLAGGLGFPDDEATNLPAMLSHGINAPRTSSVGRLFDAVACLAGIDPTITFEGQAAMALEFAAAEENESNKVAYPFDLTGADPIEIDWQPMLEAVLADRAAGVSTAQMSGRFHRGLARAVVALVNRFETRQIVLSGGCFLNRRLSDRLESALKAAGYAVFVPLAVPPGDGSIALGQAWMAGWDRPPGGCDGMIE